MISNITDLMKPLYNTFSVFTNTIFDKTTVSVDNLETITGDDESEKLKNVKNSYYEARTSAASMTLIIDGFINRYSYGVVSEADLSRILTVLGSMITFATEIYDKFQYTNDTTSYQRYKNHRHITKNIENISMVRGAIEAYNSKLIDFSEIDTLLSNYPYGAVIFDATIDNEPIKNDSDIIMAKLIALLIKLKDSGIKWAGTILDRVSNEPQENKAAIPKPEVPDRVNELDQQ